MARIKGYEDIHIPEDLENFNQRVNRIVRSQGRNMQWLQKELGINKNDFWQYCNRKRPNPRFVTQVAFCLNVDRKYLEATILPRKQTSVHTTINKLLKYDDRTLDLFIGFPLNPTLRTWIRKMLFQIVNETRIRRPIIEGMRWKFAHDKAREEMEREYNINPKQLDRFLARDERWRRKLETLTAKIEKDLYENRKKGYGLTGQTDYRANRL